MVNIIKQEVVIEKSLKKKLKKQPRILIMKCMNMLKIFMMIKKIKKKAMVLNFKKRWFIN